MRASKFFSSLFSFCFCRIYGATDWLGDRRCRRDVRLGMGAIRHHSQCRSLHHRLRRVRFPSLLNFPLLAIDFFEKSSLESTITSVELLFERQQTVLSVPLHLLATKHKVPRPSLRIKRADSRTYVIAESSFEGLRSLERPTRVPSQTVRRGRTVRRCQNRRSSGRRISRRRFQETKRMDRYHRLGSISRLLFVFI